MNDYLLRPVQMEDAQLILDARNSDRVRMHMCNQHQITEEEHQAWLKSRIDDMSVAPYCLFTLADLPLGVVGISRYEKQKKAGEWGFYLCFTQTPKGTGTRMLVAFCEMAFERCGMKKILSRVKVSNEKSIYLHRKLGFSSMPCEQKDVTAFYLDAQQWRKQRAAFAPFLETVTIKELAS